MAPSIMRRLTRKSSQEDIDGIKRMRQQKEEVATLVKAYFDIKELSSGEKEWTSRYCTSFGTKKFGPSTIKRPLQHVMGYSEGGGKRLYEGRRGQEVRTGERREEEGEKGGLRGERRKGDKGEGGERRICPIYFIYLHIPSYTFKYLHLPLYTFIYLIYPQISPCTFIFPLYFKIFNIRKMRADVKHTNGYNSSPRTSPRERI